MSNMFKPLSHIARVAAVLAVVIGAAETQPVQARIQEQVVCTFNNAMLDQGQDPSVAYQDGYYYLIQSTQNAGGITIRKSAQLSNLGSQAAIPIFEAPRPSAYGYDLWAPELVYLRGRWYIYFAATSAAGDNDTHRTFTLRAKTQDPTGEWEFMGALFNGDLDKWSIDLTAFEYKGKLYAVWSGTGNPNLTGAAFPQVTYIAGMSDPLTISTDRALLIMPDQPYEKSVQPIAEGAQPFIYDNKTSDMSDDVLTIIYSADASWTRKYNLAALLLSGDDALDPKQWTKLGTVFEGDREATGDIFGVGHNSSPVTSPDGTQHWLVYHAKLNYADGWNDRALTLKPFTYNARGTPNFGQPTDWAVDLPLPSGEPCGQTLNVPFDSADELSRFGADKAIQLTAGNTGEAVALTGKPQSVVLGKGLIDTQGSYTVSALVRPDAGLAEGTYTVVSQEGGIFSAFTLDLIRDSAGWRAAFNMNDAYGEVIATAEAPVSDADGWIALTGIRDAVTGTIQLRVNYEVVASVPFTADWRSAGSMVVGAAKVRGQRTQFFMGAIDEVKVYNGALR